MTTSAFGVEHELAKAMTAEQDKKFTRRLIRTEAAVGAAGAATALGGLGAAGVGYRNMKVHSDRSLRHVSQAVAANKAGQTAATNQHVLASAQEAGKSLKGLRLMRGGGKAAVYGGAAGLVGGLSIPAAGMSARMRARRRA